MGNEQSSKRQTHEMMYDSFMYAPVTTHRTEAEHSSRFVSAESLPPDFHRASKSASPQLLKPAYQGVWSMYHSDSLGPAARIGQCDVFDIEKNQIIIAYGSDTNGNYLNDLWSLEIDTAKWTRIAKELLSPRKYPSAVLVGREMYIFGGALEGTFYADLHRVNIDTGKLELLETKGQIAPCPRTSPMLFVTYSTKNSIINNTNNNNNTVNNNFSNSNSNVSNDNFTNNNINNDNFKDIFNNNNFLNSFNNQNNFNNTSFIDSFINNNINIDTNNQNSIHCAEATLYLWSGFDGRAHGGVYKLSLSEPELHWTRFPTSNTGLPAPAFCLFHEHHRQCNSNNNFGIKINNNANINNKGEDGCLVTDKYFVFGGVNGSPMSTFNPLKGDFDPFPCIGTEPATDLSRCSIVSCDEYLMLIGGEASIGFMHIFALDVKRKWWFAFQVRPDNNSLTVADGTINKIGLFMLPREHSASVVYSPRTRTIVSVMGSRMIEPPPIFKIEIGEALSILHLRSDMLDMMLICQNR